MSVKKAVRLSLQFEKAESNFFTCSVKFLEGKITDLYDWETVIMAPKCKGQKALAAHTKKICPRCDIPFHKEYLGKTKRRSFFCTQCQILYENKSEK